MNLCQDHWAKLKKALDDRGLTRFIRSNKEAFELTKRQLEGVDDSNGDPLLNASWAIMNNALSAAGLQVMAPGENGEPLCPICFLKTCPCGDPACAEGFEGWIERAAEEQREKFDDQIPKA